MKREKYIRFDWAMKRMLRDKANYAVLEGLLTTLFKEKITINRLLESESNQEDEFDKYNRVDILAENSKGEPRTPLEEWIYYLGTGDITNDSTAPGLDEARKKLELAMMSKDELSAYYRHLDNTVILKDNIYTSRGEGMLEGRAMGRKEGMREGMEKGIKKGREEGLAEGLKQGHEAGLIEGMERGIKRGRDETIRNIILNLRSSGASVGFITDVTGLTKDDIEELL